jgi:hypothetical protein
MKWLLPIIAAAFAIAGCAGKSVVGKWQYDLMGQSVVLDLKDDKTFTMGSAGTNVQAGTYTVQDNTVNLKFGQSTNENMTLTLSEDGNTLAGSLGAVNINLKRVEG